MGLGTTALCIYNYLFKEKIYQPGGKVLAIGSEEYDTKNPETDDLFIHIKNEYGKGIHPLNSVDPENNRLKGPAKLFYENLGCEYRSYDIDGRFGAIPFDLNYDDVPDEDKESSNFTTNHGTTEHVFNQLNCFKVIHNCTAKDGLMIHVLPCHFYNNHGMFSYSPAFFEALAKANNYDLLFMWYWYKSARNYLLPMTSNLKSMPGRTIVAAILRKKVNTEFSIPLQLSNPMLVEKTKENRYNVTDRSHLRNLNQYSNRAIKTDFKTGNYSYIDDVPDFSEDEIQKKKYIAQKETIKDLKQRIKSLKEKQSKEKSL
jgi:hypothetical protein